MRHRPAIVLTVIALGVLLAGCTVTVRTGNPSSSAVGSAGVIVWGQVGLRISLPGVIVISRHDSAHRSDTVFDSPSSLYHVYDDVDGRMRADGWRRTSYREHGDRVTAVYRRDGRVAHVTVRQEGKSGRYRLTLDDGHD